PAGARRVAARPGSRGRGGAAARRGAADVPVARGTAVARAHGRCDRRTADERPSLIAPRSPTELRIDGWPIRLSGRKRNPPERPSTRRWAREGQLCRPSRETNRSGREGSWNLCVRLRLATNTRPGSPGPHHPKGVLRNAQVRRSGRWTAWALEKRI